MLPKLSELTARALRPLMDRLFGAEGALAVDSMIQAPAQDFGDGRRADDRVDVRLRHGRLCREPERGLRPMDETGDQRRPGGDHDRRRAIKNLAFRRSACRQDRGVAWRQAPGERPLHFSALRRRFGRPRRVGARRVVCAHETRNSRRRRRDRAGESNERRRHTGLAQFRQPLRPVGRRPRQVANADRSFRPSDRRRHRRLHLREGRDLSGTRPIQTVLERPGDRHHQRQPDAGRRARRVQERVAARAQGPATRVYLHAGGVARRG